MKKNKFFQKLINNKERLVYVLINFTIVFLLIVCSSASSNSITYKINIKVDNINYSEPGPVIKPINKIMSGGFKPSNMDLSHLSGQEIPKRFLGKSPPTSFDWRSRGKITSVKNQQSCGSCYAFAALGCFESKILIHGGTTFDLSEDNVKECSYDHPCCTGGNFKNVTNHLGNIGR